MRALILIACVSVSLLAMGQYRGEEHHTITVDVDLVVFNVTVTDGGRHVSGLEAGDFRVHEDDRLQEIVLFSAEDVPASVGLIVDNSGSMREHRAEIARSTLAFADSSNSNDEMFVVIFNENVYLSLPDSTRFTNDRDEIRTALLRTAPIGMTALYDALAAGIEHVETGLRERRALVVLSDGGDNASRRNLDDVLRMAQRTNVTIYTISVYDEINRERNPGVLRKIAELSGGRAYFPNSFNELEQVWRDIAAGIDNQYTIGYRSSNRNRDGLFRTVRITAGHNDGRGFRVSARDGYLAPLDDSIAR